MGDLIGQAVEGKLHYVGEAEFSRIRTINSTIARATIFADMCRLNALYMIARAGSGHIGSSFSSMEIMSWLVLEALKLDASPTHPDNDIFYSSKGHDAPAYYSVLLATGRLPFDRIHQLRRLGGLPGHPDIQTPWIQTNTGSLGMGISKAKGMLAAKQLTGAGGRVFVLMGDGELQEGQCWESLISAANHRLDRLIVIVDHNKLQSDTFVKQVSDLGNLEEKFHAFGWHVQRIDGHDLAQIDIALTRCEMAYGKPHVIIADTVKGCGVSFMEHTALDSDRDMYRFHSGAPDKASYSLALNELIDRINLQCAQVGITSLSLETEERPASPAPSGTVQKLIPAYSQALLAAAAAQSNLVALDADLVLDTGLIPFRDRYPDRFIECGIAEQDMVSQAGGMALKGLLPVVHSFACFLSARPNEQIYNNATERTRIVYVASLAGLIPGGPGHSHQAVRDIAALKGVPGLVMIEPSCEAEVPMALEYCLNNHPGSSYLRLCSVPWPVTFTFPSSYRFCPGIGVSLTEGSDVAIFAYGPIMLSSAVSAARILKSCGIGVRVINLPWLNEVDKTWLSQEIRDVRTVVTIDNHYLSGGQGETILAAAAEVGLLNDKHVLRLGLTDVPVCGSPSEVLAHHGLDAAGISACVRSFYVASHAA